MTPLARLRANLKRVATPARAEVSQRFFKTGKGEYGEGDVFIGVTVPACRVIAKKYADLSLADIKRLLASKIHEERLMALIILTEQYRKNPSEALYRFYLAQTKHINNWDLVDTSAYRIVGEHLLHRSRAILDRLARSRNMWERRIAIVSTFRFMQQREVSDTFRIAKKLLQDPHDLMHKATCWMLREAGKKDLTALRHFLQMYAGRMPRTMLRYAIERMSPTERQKWLKL